MSDNVMTVVVIIGIFIGVIDPTEEDPAVLFHDHETGEIMRVCDHFTDFMKWPRLEVKA